MISFFSMAKVDYESFSEKEILEEIMKKKEFRELPLEDVELVYSKISEEEDLTVIEKIKMTRDLLRKMYTAFASDKLLNVKDKDAEWFLRKHISTAERIGFYDEIYSKIIRDAAPSEERKQVLLSSASQYITVFDFGCGINGFSYEHLKPFGKVHYVGTEPVGQLCDLQNNWFSKNGFNGQVEKLSLFNLQGNIELVKKFTSQGRRLTRASDVIGNEPLRVAFFFKVLDSLEMLKRDYSKEVLLEIVPLVDRVAVSWATKSLRARKSFYSQRKWLSDFIKENFKVLEEFDAGAEHYVVFSKK